MLDPIFAKSPEAYTQDVTRRVFDALMKPTIEPLSIPAYKREAEHLREDLTGWKEDVQTWEQDIRLAHTEIDRLSRQIIDRHCDIENAKRKIADLEARLAQKAGRL